MTDLKTIDAKEKLIEIELLSFALETLRHAEPSRLSQETAQFLGQEIRLRTQEVLELLKPPEREAGRPAKVVRIVADRKESLHAS